MTENDMTAALFAYIRKEEPESFAWKIHDDYTGGIPDGLLDIGGGHVWLEAKKLRSRKANPCDMLSELQKKQILKLVSLGQTVYVVGYVDNWRTVKVWLMVPAHQIGRVYSTDPSWRDGALGAAPEIDDVLAPPTDKRRVHPVLELLRWRKNAHRSATLVA